ncbi:MAG: hypothetical protein WCG87_08005 [Bacteroidota bacterium]
MKKTILLALICTLFASMDAFAQSSATDTIPPYKKHPTLPAFNILMMDSVKTFNTFNIKEGKSTILVMFSPECDHCQHFIDDMVKKMDSLSNVNIYLTTFMGLTSLKAFYDKMDLGKYKNVTVGKDQTFFFMDFYKTKFVPFVVVYDKHKKLVKSFEQTVRISDVIAATKK